MKEGKCTKKYPRNILNETITSENGYPLYRRRGPDNGGFTANIRIRGQTEFTVDNKWVVPYSKFLCKTFNAHINVVVCNSVRAIKYICKYINKGSDQAIFNLQHQGQHVDLLNEVQLYQHGRYISSKEAVWRILGFPLHERYPAVQHW